MFTGIIEDVGSVVRAEPSRDLVALTISTRLRGLKVSGSIAVDGICLTIVRTGSGKFVVEAARETLRRTTLKGWAVGRRVNLERPLRAGAELGGHFVQGHVDAVGRILSARRASKGMRLDISLPASVRRYAVEKGSIAVDGVSLTVNRTGRADFSVFLIPFTLAHTTLGGRRSGQCVNVETDMLARHAAKFVRRA